MTMILRIPHNATVLYRTFRVQQSTKIVHYNSTGIWRYGFDHLYNDQLKSVVKTHGVGYDCDGWAGLIEH